MKKLSKTALNLEDVFGNPQDIEWGWDGKEVYISQSRNVTTLDKYPKIINYTFDRSKIIGTGIIACKGVASGFLKVINNIEDYDKINKGDIVLVKRKLDTSLIKKMSFINGLILNGGILSHIVVIAREFNIPCLTEPEIINGKIEKYINRKIIVDAIKGKILLA